MEMVTAYIEVAVALPVEMTYTYAVPESLVDFIAVGRRVIIPFQHRRVTGYILGPSKNTEAYKIKFILDVLDDAPLFPASMLPFFRWIAEYYIHPLGAVIQSALPSGINRCDVTEIAITPKGLDALSSKAVPPLQHKILDQVKSRKYPLKRLSSIVGQEICQSLIKRMENSGWITKQQTFIGSPLKAKTVRYVSLKRSDLPQDRFFPARKKIIDILRSQDDISIKSLTAKMPNASSYLSYLIRNGYIAISHKREYRDPLGEPIAKDCPPPLTKEQRQAIAGISGAVGKTFKSFLLAGVTGSGKTEIYLALTQQTIDQGYGVLVLVPEIALISQTVSRFRARFGDRIAVLHSALSKGERYDQWRRILTKQVPVAIGVRSAIFAPLENLKLIIVDEEHDTSYKQDQDLRYHARDMAVMRAKLQNAVVILGSATPSIQSYYNVTTGKSALLTLTRRVEERSLPEIDIIDLRQTRDQRGARRLITSPLHQAMAQTLERKEQVLLFLNRRGFAGHPVCAACGSPLQCKFCDISLTLHKNAHAYKCHYCGFMKAAVAPCPTCGSSQIKNLGFGTEKVEAAVKSLFPEAKVVRMDRDTTTRKGAVIKILKGLHNRSIDILIGTQMVAKGHDFPNITLVGIICADLALNFPDFRASEHTFQLLAQVSGRAGRGDVAGRVILQTFNPNHFSILAAKNQNFLSFFETEIAFRAGLDYPPFSRMIQLKISGRDSKQTQVHAKMVGQQCQALQTRDKSFMEGIQILGPVEAPLAKAAGRYRWQILLKSAHSRRLHRFIRELAAQNKNLFSRPKVKIAIDVDPIFMI
jgi:primosomal protein N' (replication factor Y)